MDGYLCMSAVQTERLKRYVAVRSERKKKFKRGGWKKCKLFINSMLNCSLYNVFKYIYVFYLEDSWKSL